MSPELSIHNAYGRAGSNFKRPGDTSCGLTTSRTGSYVKNVCLCQFGSPMGNTSGPVLRCTIIPAFADLVDHIVSRRPLLKMIGVNATWVVAFMENVGRRVQVFGVHDIAKSVSVVERSSPINSPVSNTVGGSGPFPALTGLHGANLLKYAHFEFVWKIRMRYNRVQI